MNVIRKIGFLLPALLLLVSCSKEMRKYEGSYTFKTSGCMQWEKVASGTDMMGDSIYPDTLDVTMVNEMGQLNVVEKDKKNKRMLLTMNLLGAGVYSVEAEVKEDGIFLDTVKRQVSYSVNGGLAHQTDILMTGIGHRYGNVLLFKFEFLGECLYLDERYRILSSDVECVAEINE